MRTHRYVLLFYFLTVNSFLFSQYDKSVKATESVDAGLHIGDTVPDILFTTMINGSLGSAKLSDFKGKLIILDFWNKGCAPCISGMPKMQQLQEQFEGKIQVLFVNVLNSREGLEMWGFPNETPSLIIPKIKLPFVLDSKELAELFPHVSEPYHVWIDGNRKVIATAPYYSSTPQRVKDYLSGKPVRLLVQENPEDLNYNSIASLLDITNKQVLDKVLLERQNFLYSSFILPNVYMRGLTSNIYDTASKTKIGTRINSDIIHLFKVSFSNKYPLVVDIPDRVVLEVKNPENYIIPNKDDVERKAIWLDNNQYCYELKLPLMIMKPLSSEGRQNMIDSIMRGDLERFLNVKATVEKRLTKCRILIRKSNMDQIKSKEGEYINQKTYEGGLRLKNGTFGQLIHELQYALLDSSTKPLIDETGFSAEKRIDITFKSPLYNLQKVRENLKAVGLDIVEELREIEVMVIRQNDFKLK